MPRPILLFQDQYVLIDSRCRARYCWNNHYPTVVYPTWIHLPSVSHLQLGWQKSAIWVIMGNFSVPELPSRRNILFSPDGQRGRVPHLSPERGAPPPPLPSIHPEPNTHTHTELCWSVWPLGDHFSTLSCQACPGCGERRSNITCGGLEEEGERQAGKGNWSWSDVEACRVVGLIMLRLNFS